MKRMFLMMIISVISIFGMSCYDSQDQDQECVCIEYVVEGDCPLVSISGDTPNEKIWYHLDDGIPYSYSKSVHRIKFSNRHPRAFLYVHKLTGDATLIHAMIYVDGEIAVEDFSIEPFADMFIEYIIDYL